MTIPLISHLGRGFSLKNIFHQHAVAIVAGPGLFLFLTEGKTQALAAILTLFMVWALAREIVPEKPVVALYVQVGYLFLATFFPFLLSVPLFSFVILLFCSRAISGITGSEARWYDWMALMVISLWNTFFFVNLLIIAGAFLLTRLQLQKSSKEVLCDNNTTYQSRKRVNTAAIFSGIFLLILILSQIVVY